MLHATIKLHITIIIIIIFFLSSSLFFSFSSSSSSSSSSYISDRQVRKDIQNEGLLHLLFT
jgi:hypothetical protein